VLVSVAVPVPFLDRLTYRVPAELDAPAPGARVLVPLGRRTVTGCVVAVDDRAGRGDDESVKDVIDVLDDRPFLPPDVMELAVWTAEYYMAGLGDTIAAAMPPRAWIASERQVRITDLGLARVSHASGTRLALLEILRDGAVRRVDALRVRGARAAGGETDRRGVRALVTALERDGLVEVLQPLKGKAAAFKTVGLASLTAQGHEAVAGNGDAPGFRLGSRQRDALEMLRGAPDGLPLPALASRGISSGSVARLRRLGLVEIRRGRVDRDPFSADAPVEERSLVELTEEQTAACSRLTALAAERGFHAALLHGVTGSGKTEIYVRLAREVRASGRSVLVLVPEIALTPAVAAAFRSAFGARVAIQHSGLADGERHDQWHRIRDGLVDVVVGTRSAVFAPIASPGLIVVDEEHDGSYKQEETPRYNGRDVAIMRAKKAGALVVLGSATPSMESYQNARSGRYHLVTLARRVLDRPLASVQIVNMREEYATAGPDAVLSRSLSSALEARLDRREQSLILLNRRGFATAVFCRQCAGTLECPNCSVSLTVHRAAHRARCHYCNYSMPLPKACVSCAAPYLEQMGFGTERVEAEIRSVFPRARVERLDRDTIRRRGAAADLLLRFARREVDILVGTQMIAKGHDFPFVTLVGVISADVGLGLADFRAAERTFQLLTQVAGRAGRGETPGEAIVQTLYPDHYSIRHACRQDYLAFFHDELKFRQAMRYPPAANLINVVVRGRTRADAMSLATGLAIRLRRTSDAYSVLGPAPAPLGKLRGEHRVQMFLKGRQRVAMRAALAAALDSQPDLRRKIAIDVDPVGML
jgi:primosomal protein N' (replication factor Y)